MPCDCQPFVLPLKCQRNSCSLKSCRPSEFNSAEELEQFRASACNSTEPITAAVVKPAPLSTLRGRAWNLVQSLAVFVTDGLRLVTPAQYKERLEICDQCPHRSHNRCLKCGCNLTIKAKGRAFNCPDNRWPKLT